MAALAVITGAGRGIGRATALCLAGRGLDLALLGHASAEQDASAATCRAAGVVAHCYGCDVAEAAEVQAATEALLAAQGAPTVLINNAAINRYGPLLHELKIASFDRIMAVNLRGPFLVCRALLPAMLEAGRGRIIQVASISATTGSARMASYCASKWGLVGLTKSLAAELRGSGLQALAVLPGSVDTDMLADTPFAPEMTSEQVAAIISYYALDAPAAVSGAAVELFG